MHGDWAREMPRARASEVQHLGRVAFGGLVRQLQRFVQCVPFEGGTHVLGKELDPLVVLDLEDRGDLERKCGVEARGAGRVRQPLRAPARRRQRLCRLVAQCREGEDPAHIPFHTCESGEEKYGADASARARTHEVPHT